MVVAPETQQKQESPEFCFPPPGILPITCGQGPGDSEPRRLVGLANIIGNLTNILPALRLCHIIQGQHLRIRAINPRVLEQTNNMESHGCAQQQQRPEGRQRLCQGRGCCPHTHSWVGGWGCCTRGVMGGRNRQAWGCNPAPPASQREGAQLGMAAWSHRMGWKGPLKATQCDPLPQQEHQLDWWPVCPLSGTAGVQRGLLALGRSRAQLPAPALGLLPGTAHPALCCVPLGLQRDHRASTAVAQDSPPCSLLPAGQ